MTSNDVSLQFLPHVIWRKGTLSQSTLASLTLPKIWQMYDSQQERNKQRLELINKLTDNLYSIIPTRSSSDRRFLLKLRRDIHNQRAISPDDIDSCKVLLDKENPSILSDLLTYTTHFGSNASQLKILYSTAVENARLSLKSLETNESFLFGLQLSGMRVYKDVRGFLDHVISNDGRINRKYLKTERTILRYLYRMAYRTAPFGAFTHVGAFHWNADNTIEPYSVTSQGRLVRLNRGLLAWILYVLKDIPALQDCVFVRLNNTLTFTGASFEAFVRGEDGTSSAYWGEKLVKIKTFPLLEEIVRTLTPGPQRIVALCETITSFGYRPLQVRAILSSLIDKGLLHSDFNIPDQEFMFPETLIAACSNTSDSVARKCGIQLYNIKSIIARFATSRTLERERLLEELNIAINDIARTTNRHFVSSVARSYVFEDVATHNFPDTWFPKLLQRNKANFHLIHKLLPIMDNTTFSKLGLYSWFASQFSESKYHPSVLDVYKIFSVQSEASKTRIMTGGNSSTAAQVQILRQRIQDTVTDQVSRVPRTDSLQLEIDKNIILLARNLGIHEWSSASHRLQFATDYSKNEFQYIVLNESATGYGTYYSRFCDLFHNPSSDRMNLADALRTIIARMNPSQADIVAVFGKNVNLHPDLTTLSIVYPGSISSHAQKSLTLRDVKVVADHESHRLHLVDASSGTAIVVVPLNFLFPSAAPSLYRFICALSSIHGRPIGFYDHLIKRSPCGNLDLPRLMLGDVVIERHTWIRHKSQLTPFKNLSLSNVAWPQLLAIKQWQEAESLPVEGYFRLFNDDSKNDKPFSWTETPRRWALNARSARHKSQYLNFHNPFLINLLLHELRTRSYTTFVMQEALPRPPTFSSERSDDSYLEEFLIETQVKSF